MVKNSKKFNFNRRSAAVALAVLVILVILIFWLARPSIPAGTIPSTSPVNNSRGSTGNGSNNSGSQSGGNTTTAPSGTKNQTSSTSASGSGPITPYGNFVSNHHPGGADPTSEASVCITSPGATCYIEFTKGGETKKLDTETTDSSGSAYWYWDTKTAGLDSGSWTVTAIAELNYQTAKATDNQFLVIQ